VTDEGYGGRRGGSRDRSSGLGREDRQVTSLMLYTRPCFAGSLLEREYEL
jgi:hypothetical protein